MSLSQQIVELINNKVTEIEKKFKKDSNSLIIKSLVEDKQKKELALLNLKKELKKSKIDLENSKKNYEKLLEEESFLNNTYYQLNFYTNKEYNEAFDDFKEIEYIKDSLKKLDCYNNVS